MARTIVQILASRVHEDHVEDDVFTLLSQYVTRAKINRLTKPDDATADYERQEAFSSFLKTYRKMPSLKKVFKKCERIIVGDPASIQYGSTRTLDDIEVLIPSPVDYYQIRSNLHDMDFISDPASVDLYRDCDYFSQRHWNYIDSEDMRFLCLTITFPTITDVTQVIEDELNFTEDFPTTRGERLSSLHLLVAMKLLAFTPVDIADIVEIIQGGAGIAWTRVRSIIERFGGDDRASRAISRLVMLDCILDEHEKNKD